jgi:hypothetical protein
MTTNRRHRRHFPQALPAPLGSASAGTQAPQGVSLETLRTLRPARSLHNDLPRKEWERFVGFNVTAVSLAPPAIAYPVASTTASRAAKGRLVIERTTRLTAERGNEVVALTEASATIQGVRGRRLSYYRRPGARR